MYTILVTDSNELVASVKERIMQRSKLVDNLHFLVNPSYKGIDMSTFTVTMEYVLPVSREYKTETLVKSADLYKDMLEYKLPMDTNLTKEAGKVEMQLTFTKVGMDADGNVQQQVRKTSTCTVTIIPITAWSDVVPDNALSALDQRILALDAYVGQLMDLEQYNFENKADNIVYNEDDSTIQLTANEVPIGDKIVISTDVANVRAIESIEIDAEHNLIAKYTDGSVEIIGKVSDKCPGVYVPSFVDPDKLVFTLQDEPVDTEIKIDINRDNEWSTEDDAGTTNYIWETL